MRRTNITAWERGMNLVGRPLTVERLQQLWRAFPFAMIGKADRRQVEQVARAREARRAR